MVVKTMSTKQGIGMPFNIWKCHLIFFTTELAIQVLDLLVTIHGTLLGSNLYRGVR